MSKNKEGKNMNEEKKSTHEYWKIAGKAVDEYMSARTDYLMSLAMNTSIDIEPYVESLAISEVMYDIDKILLPLQEVIEYKRIKKSKVEDASILKIEIERSLFGDDFIVVFLFPDNTEYEYVYPLEGLIAFNEEDKEDILFQKNILLGIIKMLKEYRVMKKLLELQKKIKKYKRWRVKHE